MPGQVAARVAGWERTCGSWPVQRVTGPATVTFGPGTPLLISVRIALGADLTADPLTWVWTDISSYVRFNPGIRVTTGRLDESSTTAPGTGTLTLNNRDGRFSRTNAAGPYYGQLTRNTPIWVTVDAGLGAYDLIRAYVNEWPARWDPTGTDFTVPVQCSGVLRRLGQGGTLQSLLDRYLPNFAKRYPDQGYVDPVDYWPMEDGSTATQLANTIGSHPMSMAGTVNLANESTLPGSNPLPVPTSGSTLFGLVSSFGTSYSAETSGWAIAGAIKLPSSAPSTEATIWHWWALSGPIVQWKVAITTTGTLAVRGYNSALTEVFADAGYDITAYLGDWIYLSATLYTDLVTPPDFQLQLNIFTADRPGGIGYSGMAVQSGIAGQPYAIEHLGFGTAIGHLAIYPSNALPMEIINRVAFGLTGERAGTRITRVCAEEDVRVTVTDAAGSTTMGPQIRGTLLQVLRDCEAADLGVLAESGWNLAYQSRAERYNAPVAMTIDYTSGTLATIEPTDDDQRLRNKWTVTRTNGSSATATDQPCIDLHGLYADTATVNVQSDTQVQHVANWLVHRGITDDLRWPNIGLHLDNIAGRQMIATWMGVQVGSRVQITNLPTQVVADTVDVFVEGITQTVTPLTWTATMMTTPASPFNIFTLGDTSLGRLDSDTSTLAAAIGTADTSLSVAVAVDDFGATVLWTTDATECPFDIDLDGERVTVTAISGGSSPQTFTVTRSVNGVSKTHTAGTAVTLWHPGVLAL
jgi:hypothetical protein